MGIVASAIIQKDGLLPLPAEVAAHLKVSSPDEVIFSFDGDAVVMKKKPKEMPLDIKHYLNSGYDLLAATYLASKRKKLIEVFPQFDNTLILIYEKDEKRKLDCKPLMAEGGLFAHLRNFRGVFLNAKVENNAVFWKISQYREEEEGSSIITIDADTCYIKSVPACVTDLTREEMLDAKQASMAMGVDLKDEDGIAGFALSRRILGLSGRGK